LGFTGFESLAGGQAEDTFQFADGSVISVAISGGLGNDVVVANGNGTDFSVNLTDAGSILTRSGAASQTSSFEGIESLSGAAGDDIFAFTDFGNLSGSIDGSGGTDRVTGDDNGNIFTVTSPNAGTLVESDGLTAKVGGGFINVEQLFGGLGADVFNVNDSLSGDSTAVGVPSRIAINAGAGQDTVTVADDVTMTGGIETGSEVDTVTVGNQVTIDGGIGLGSGNDNIQFNGVATADLAAGSGNDQITLATTSVVTGTLDGGTGSDTITTGDVATTFVIDGVDAGSVIGRASGFQGVENLVAGSLADVFRFQGAGALTAGSIDGGAGLDRIEGDGDANRFVISGIDSGSYFADASLTASTSFTDVESLDGRSGNDVFEFGIAGFLTGNVDGGAGSDELVGSDNGDVFDVTADNAGVLYDGAGLANPRMAGFVSIENLTGGDGIDEFTVRSGVTIGGNLNGSGGDDSFVLEANSTVGGDLAGGAGNNTLTLNSGAQILGNVSDVTVDINIDGTAAADTFVVRLNAGVLEVLVNGVQNQFLTPSGGSINLAINTGDMGGDDYLTVDNSNGLVAANITYVGGAETTADRIRLVGLQTMNAVYTPSAITSGEGVVIVEDPVETQTITFTGLESVDIDGLGNLAIVTEGSQDVVSLDPGRDAASNSLDSLIVSGTSDGVAFLSAHIRNVAGLDIDLATNDGATPDDSVTVADGATSVAPGLLRLDISTGNGSDEFDITGTDLPLASGAAVPTAGTTSVFSGVVGTITDVVTADFNGDLILDLAAATSGGQVVVALGVGNGTFVSQTPINIGTGPLSIATGNFNGDAAVDLVTGDGFSDSVTILLNNNDGTGNFTALPSIPIPGLSPNDLEAADLNGDGFDDIAVADVGAIVDLGFILTTGSGPGVFQTPTTQQSGVAGTQLVVGDFDGLPGLDIVTSSRFTFGGPWTLLTNNGAGQFTARTPGFTSSGAASRVASGDIDGNGTLDVVLLETFGGVDQAQVYSNDGSGNFTLTTTVSLPANTGEIDLVDFNLDGFLDIVVSDDMGAGSVSVAIRNADGTFQTPVSSASGTVASGFAMVVGDFDNDGDSDILQVDASDNIGVVNNPTAQVERLTIDAGIGTDRITVTSDVELIELDSSTSQIRIGTVAAPGSQGVINLVGLIGEDVTVSGGAGDNTIDLSQWSNGARAVINGQAGSDTFVGLNVDSNWTITGNNSGQVGDFTFNDIENLVGGTGDDVFIFNGGSLEGSVDGGAAGNDSLSVGNTANTWTVSQNGGGAVRLGAAVTDPQLAFTNLNTINGGTDTDSFVFAGGTIAAITGGTGEDTVTGDNLATTWNIDDVNGDFSAADEGTFVSSNGATQFAGIENLIGGDSADAFVFARAARISRTIDGGGGTTNTVNVAAYNTQVTATLTGTGSVTGFAGTTTGTTKPVGDTFDNISAISFNTGSTTFGDTLVGLNGNAQWVFVSNDRIRSKPANHLAIDTARSGESKRVVAASTGQRLYIQKRAELPSQCSRVRTGNDKRIGIVIADDRVRSRAAINRPGQASCCTKADRVAAAAHDNISAERPINGEHVCRTRTGQVFYAHKTVDDLRCSSVLFCNRS